MFIDISCALLVALSFYFGYTRGIIKTVFGVLSIVIGLLATLKFSHLSIGLVEKILDVDPRLNIIIGFVLTFLIVLIGIRLLGRGLEKLLETANINFVNQIAGGAVSALITLLIYSSILGFLDKIRVIKPEVKSSSISYPLLQTVPEKSKVIIDYCKPIFSEFWQKTNEALEKVDQAIPERELTPEEAK